MNYTTQVLRQYVRDQKEFFKTHPDFVEERQRQVSDQRTLEAQYLNENSTVCPKRYLDDYVISDVKPEMVQSAMGKQFYNYDAALANACLVSAMFYPLPLEEGSASYNENLRSKIKNFRRIGSESAFGYALTGDIQSSKDLFVAKVSKDEDGINDLLHEYFVGATSINSLRKNNVPNFTVTFAASKHSKPIIDPRTKKVVLWDSEDDPVKVPYVIYENVSPSISAAKYLETCNARQFLSMSYQIWNCLDEAAQLIGFTHYDLHTENVLMRDVSQSTTSDRFQIPYKKGYVVADKLATIIDYGMCVVNYKGQMYGNPEALPEKNARYRDKTFPLADAYKFLLFCARDVMDTKNPHKTAILSVIARIFRFFNKTEALENVIDSQWDLRYPLVYNNSTASYTMADLINYVMYNVNSANVFFNRMVPGYRILKCSSCYTLSSISTSAGAKKGVVIPKTFRSFYDKSNYIRTNYPQSYSSIFAKFDYNTAKRGYLEEVRTLIAGIPERVEVPELGDILETTTLETVKNYHFNIFNRLADIEDLRHLIVIGTYVSSVFRDQDLRDRLEQLRDLHSRLLTELCEDIGKAHSNYNVILESLKDKKIDRKLAWYVESASQIATFKSSVCDVAPVPQEHSKIEAPPKKVIRRRNSTGGVYILDGVKTRSVKARPSRGDFNFDHRSRGLEIHSKYEI